MLKTLVSNTVNTKIKASPENMSDKSPAPDMS